MDGLRSIDYSSLGSRERGERAPQLRQERCAKRAPNHEKVPFGFEIVPFPAGRRLTCRGSIFAAIGSTLFRSPDNSKPVRYASSGHRRSAWPTASASRVR